MAENICRKAEVKLIKSTTENTYKITSRKAGQTSKCRTLASGSIYMNAQTLDLVKNKSLPEGDVFAMAKIAGMQGSKKVADLLPTVQGVLLDSVEVSIDINETENSLKVNTAVSAVAVNSVDMEALTATNTALLSIYQMIKSSDSSAYIGNVMIEVKENSHQGLWINPAVKDAWAQLIEAPALTNMTANVITLSDRASCGEYEDLSGPEAVRILKELGAEVKSSIIIPDEEDVLEKTLNDLETTDLIITTGGTGIAKRDITPDVLDTYCDRTFIGFGEFMRNEGIEHSKFTWLSRSIAGVKDKTLIVALPGNPKAVKECFAALQTILPHSIRTIQAG